MIRVSFSAGGHLSVRRTEQTLEWVTAQGSLLDIARDHLSLGRAHMATSPPDPATAEQHLREAVDGLRTSGSTNHLPRGLLARAEFHWSQDNLELEQTRWHLAKNDPDSARNTLDKAKDLVDSMDYGRRRPEVKTLEAEIAAAAGPGRQHT